MSFSCGNTMPNEIQIVTPVTLYWEAITRDGLVLKQYTPENQEINFREVLNLQEKNNLHYFFLLPVVRDYLDKINIGVDLTTGLFIINGIKMDVRPDIIKELVDPFYRIIFHRRRKEERGVVTGDLVRGKIAFYLLGWQITLEDKNYQRILFFDPETLTFVIREKR